MDSNHNNDHLLSRGSERRNMYASSDSLCTEDNRVEGNVCMYILIYAFVHLLYELVVPGFDNNDTTLYFPP